MQGRQKGQKNAIYFVSLFGVFVVIVIIFMFSAQPYSSSVAMTRDVRDVLSEHLAEDSYLMASGLLTLRKLAHVFMYSILGLLFYIFFHAKTHSRKKAVSTSAAFCFAISVFDEFHQTFVYGRTGTVDDVGIDAAGYLTVLLVCFLVSKSVDMKKQADKNKEIQLDSNILGSEVKR